MSVVIKMMVNLDEKGLLEEVQNRLAGGEDPHLLLEECREGMQQVGKLFEEGEYYLSELIMAGELINRVSTLLKPGLAGKTGGPPKGKIVMGTVKSDIHFIGKDIVTTVLRGANYQVEDLGVDVPPEVFVQGVRDSGARVVGLSCLLTVAFDEMKATVEALRELPFPVKVMIGGGPVTEEIKGYVGADALGRDALAAVRICDRWFKGGEGATDG